MEIFADTFPRIILPYNPRKSIKIQTYKRLYVYFEVSKYLTNVSKH